MSWYLRAVLIAALAPAALADDHGGAAGAGPVVPQYDGRTAAEWVAQLQSEDVQARQKAAYALFKLGADAKDAAAALVHAVRDSDAYVRTTSSKAVERLGAGVLKPLASDLAAMLSDDRPEVRREAAALFWRLGPLAAEAVPELTKALASEDDVVRGRAAWCLGNAGASGKPALDALAKSVDDPVEDVSKGAANAIARIDPATAFASQRANVRLAALQAYGDSPKNREWTDPVIVAGVLNAIDDRNEEVRGWAVHALDTFAALSGDAPPVAWIAVFRRVLDKEPAVAPRAAAAYGLGRYKGHGPEVVPPLIDAVRGREPDVRFAALLALGWIGPEAKAAVPLAVDALRDDSALVRSAAAAALRGIGASPDAAIDALAAATSDTDRSVVSGALTALGAAGKGSERVAAILTQFVLRPASDPYACAEAVRMLVFDETAAHAIPVLTVAFEKDSDAPLAVAFALRALDAPAGDRALARLVAALGDAAQTRRALALLRMLGAKAVGATSAVVPFLAHDDAQMRITAAVVLGAIGPGAKDALPALERLLHDADENVGRAAKQVIGDIRAGAEPAK